MTSSSSTSQSTSTGQNPPAPDQPTTGQNEGSGQKPSDKQSSSGQTNPPSTTGQGSDSSKPKSSGSSMNGGSSSSMPSQSGSSSPTPGASGQNNLPEKNTEQERSVISRPRPSLRRGIFLRPALLSEIAGTSPAMTSWQFRNKAVMPGLVPGIHVLLVAGVQSRGWPGQARP